VGIARAFVWIARAPVGSASGGVGAACAGGRSDAGADGDRARAADRGATIGAACRGGGAGGWAARFAEVTAVVAACGCRDECGTAGAVGRGALTQGVADRVVGGGGGRRAGCCRCRREPPRG